MKIVFGPVPPEFVDNAETFVSSKGDPFYFELEITEEEGADGTFSISDNCGRYMPFDFENLDDLILVLSKLKSYRDSKIAFDKFWQNVWKAGK